jgi:pimeloyl-ACP methyl ester carboxylesterase
VRPMALRLAEHYRVIIYDRRNTGGSDLRFDGARSEQELWASDLYGVLAALDAVPAYVFGVSLGAGVSLAMTLAQPHAVRALVLAWIAGGEFPRDRLARELYGQFVDAAEAGGMAAVADTAFFRARCADNPDARAQLLALDRDWFVARLRAWEAAFRTPQLIPPIARDTLAAAQLALPVLTIAGDDEIHLESVAREVHELLPGSRWQPPMLTRAEWEALGAPAPPGHPDRHRATAEYRGQHVPPVVHAFLRSLA